jgi:hypothetical protein
MNETSIEIVKMLRDARLGWIADELVESLALGKQVTKHYREPGAARATRATTIEPFSDDEELELVVETLAQYFLVLPEAWDRGSAWFANPRHFQNIDEEDLSPSTSPADPAKLGITGDGDSPFQTFSREYRQNTLPRLRKTLADLWPAGRDDFHRRFQPEETK